MMIPGPTAYFNDNRWIVECVTDFCNDAHANPIMGWACINGHDNPPPVFPPNRNAIEKVLAKRPNPRTRNWLPGETVDLLKAENIEHGVAV